MALTVGSRLGHYDVTALIGEGGMGQVYQATDTHLDRQVAIKVLPDAFSNDADRLARFEREAKVLASLNHPNIGAIYGLEKSGDTRALVLELVEGPTLADRIAEGPIPVDEALPIAKQIAEALEAAHEAGVIHRDLKPANIKVREDGTVKVLDFGLAKALDTAPEGDPSQSPTLTAAATQMGVIMGTAAYMSPEQASGKPADKRADIWAFGVVLYEMLTGVRPFTGDDVSRTLAHVIAIDPDWRNLPKDLPPVLRNFLRVCLQKDPRERVCDIGDVRLAVVGAFDVGVNVPSEAIATTQVQIWQRPVSMAAGALVLVAVSGLAVWTATRPESPRMVHLLLDASPPVHLSTGGTPSVVFSPDGTRVVYVANTPRRELFVRRLDQAGATLLRGAEGINPFFSPDGEWVAFRAIDDSLRRVSVQGGPPVTITRGLRGVLGASWGPDDTIVLAPASPGGLFTVSAAGGERLPLTELEEGEIAHRWPEFLPGGEAVLFTIVKGPSDQNAEVALLDLSTGERTRLVSGGSNPRYSPTGHIVYGLDGTLRAVPFDVDTRMVTGDPVPVLEGVAAHVGRGATHFSLAPNGSLVYVTGGPGSGGSALGWVDRDGREERLSAPIRPYFHPSVSPDGGRVALHILDGEDDIWVWDFAGEILTRVTVGASFEARPVWTPDGQRVVFSSTRDGNMDVYSKGSDGTGVVERLSEHGAVMASGVTRDGLRVVASAGEPGDLVFLRLDHDGSAEALLTTEFDEQEAALSPDGEWIAFESDASGQYEIYVRPFPDVDTGRWQVSASGGRYPRWSRDGRELFYWAGTRVMAAPIETEPNFRRDTPQELFEGTPDFSETGRTYDVGRDGRFLMVLPAEETDRDVQPSQVNIVLNWSEHLKLLVPVD